MPRGIMVFAEQKEGTLSPVVYELIGKAKELAETLNEPISCVLLGYKINKLAQDLLKYGVDIVYLYRHKLFIRFRDDPYSKIISDLINEVKPSILLIGATNIGRSLAPRISTKLKTGLTADCTGLYINKEGNLIQTRPAYGGTILADIVCSKNRPQIATVRYKVMKKALPSTQPHGIIQEKIVNVTDLPDRTNIISFRKNASRMSLVDSEIIVTGGRGLGDPDGFALLRKLASLLGGAVGASRSAVDEGWIDYSYQIGLSGLTVRPKLYIACGISGSVQHLAGMQTSEIIIAINKDPLAPIFNIATYGIVGDLYEVIPSLINLIKQKKS